jgi:phage terminase small subunit
MSDLTHKQEKFCQEYATHGNATRAAINAGYSEKTAYAIGHENLSKLEISERILELTMAPIKKLEITRERVIEEMARIAFADPRKMFTETGDLRPIHELDDDTAATLAGVEVVTVTRGRGEDAEVDYVHKVKHWDKGKMLSELGKHFNIYEDHQKSGTGEIHVHIEGKDSEL